MKKNILFITIILALFFLVDRFIWLTKDSFISKIPKSKESIWEIRTNKIKSESKTSEVIFLGDSTVRTAVNEKLASETLGAKVLNLGLTGDLISYGSYKILSTYLKKFPAPKTVVFWHTVDVWNRKLDPFIFLYTNPSQDSLIDFYRINFKNNLHKFLPVLWENFLVNNIALYRYKTTFREFYLNSFQVSVQQSPHKASIPTIHWNKSMNPKISEENLFWLKRLKELCDKNNIKLVTAHSPLLKDYYELPEMQFYLMKQKENLNTLFKSLDIPIITPNYFVFESDETYDLNMDHMNEKGSLRGTIFYMKSLMFYLKLAEK